MSEITISKYKWELFLNLKEVNEYNYLYVVTRLVNFR